MIRIELIFSSVSDYPSEFFYEQLKKFGNIKSFESIKLTPSRFESILAWTIVSSYFSERSLPFSVAYEPGGKPYVPGSPIRFSISHSKGRVVVGFSESEIGVDIEEIKEKDHSNLYRRVLSENEAVRIRSASDEKLSFFKLWSLKEAHLKLTGAGLAGEMTKIDFGDFFENESFEKDGKHYYSTQLSGFSLAVCCEKPFELSIKEKNYE